MGEGSETVDREQGRLSTETAKAEQFLERKTSIGEGREEVTLAFYRET